MKSRIEAAALILLAGAAFAGPVPEVMVPAAVETAATEGDADDPAIWVNPADPAQSRVIGTDKDIGLRVYDLSGALVQSNTDGRLNNVDVRPFAGMGGVALVGATKREDDTLVFYAVAADGTLTPAEPFAFPAAPPHRQGETDDVYGFALGQDPATGETWAIANYKSGHIFQWRVTAPDGRLALDLAREWLVPTQPEGMVTDDRAGMIYVGEEDGGVWRLPASPSTAPEAVKIASVGDPCLPVDDVEGLAIYDGPRRFLVVSAQGIHRAAIYDLAQDPPACLGLAGIAAGAVDGVTETDGLDVTATALPGFPQGMLVMMDDQNAGYTTNFKLIPWGPIAAGLGL